MVDKQIQINNPCPMLLSKMKINNGFYCSSCKKDIVDYRGKSEDQILQQIKENTCGIFDEDAVNTPNFGLRYRFLFKLLTILSFLGLNVKPIQAQVVPKQQENITIEKNSIHETVIGKIKIEHKRDTLLFEDPSTKNKKKWFVKRKKKKPTYKTIGCPSF
jgi:hypothetical protein